MAPAWSDVLYVLLLASICNVGLQKPSSAPIYAELLARRYHGVAGELMIVKDRTVAMPTLVGSATDWLAKFGDVPAELRQAASRQAPTKIGEMSASMLPPRTRIVSTQAVDAIFTGSDLDAHWIAFYRQFDARGWISFSDVIVTDSGLDALVYYESRCGGLCGEGGYVWLHRGTSRSQWVVTKQVISWMA